MKQSLQDICHWEREHSNSSLQIRANECRRLDNFEFFPVAMALCKSWTCIGSFQILYPTSSLSEFSLGIVYLKNYAFDFNLADSVGKIPLSWGLCQNGYSAAKLYANQTFIKNTYAIKNEDIVSIYMDLNEGGDQGYAHFFINKQHAWSVKGLECDEAYAIACTMSPDSKVIIKDKYMPLGDVITLTAEYSASDDKTEYIWSEVKVFSSSSTRVNSLFDSEESNELQSSNGSRFDINFEHKSVSEGKDELEFKESHDNNSVANLSTTPINTPSASVPVPNFFPSKSLLAPKSPKTKEIGDKTSSGDTSHTMECCVCMSNARCMLFMPCKHLCTCEECGGDGKNSDGAGGAGVLVYCPMCRLKIKSRMKVFM